MASKMLPLGAVRTDDGEVVVPASRRADGSVRKSIRIRQGYVPQDEVPKYKTVAQRKREEQDAKQAAGQQSADGESELSLQSLTLESKAPAAVASSDRPTSVRGPDQRKARAVPAAAAEVASRGAAERKPSAQGSASGAHDAKDQRHAAELKQELSKLNKLLKEIGKLEERAQQDEDEATVGLTLQQQGKIERKQELQRKRNEIIAELNGAAISSSPASGSSRVAAPGTEASTTATKKTFVAIEM